MESILFPVLSLGGTGLAMGLFLAYASKKFEVKVDEKVEAIQGILPGINCGACGYPGCSGYAEAIALNGAEMTACSPGGPAVAAEIAKVMGATVDLSGPKMVAKLLCQGDCTKTTKTYEFEGELTTCSAINLYGIGCGNSIIRFCQNYRIHRQKEEGIRFIYCILFVYLEGAKGPQATNIVVAK